MNIEVIEFFPLGCDAEKDSLSGTLKIRLLDFGVFIQGIHVSKRKKSWFFSLPGRQGTRHDTGEIRRYSFIMFEDRTQQQELVQQIREKGRLFIEQRLADTEKPPIFPQGKPKMSNGSSLTKARNPATEQKEKAMVAKPKSLSSIAAKEWRDPPTRQSKARSSSKFARQ